MSLQDKTIDFIINYIKRMYSKALENGAVLSSVQYVEPHLYFVCLGHAQLCFLGSADCTARLIACSGDIFD